MPIYNKIVGDVEERQRASKRKAEDASTCDDTIKKMKDLEGKYFFNPSYKFLYLISLFYFKEKLKIAKRMFIHQDQCKECKGWEEERRVARVKTDNKTAGAHHFRSKCNSLNELQKPHNAHYHVDIHRSVSWNKCVTKIEPAQP